MEKLLLANITFSVPGENCNETGYMPQICSKDADGSINAKSSIIKIYIFADLWYLFAWTV